MARPYKQGVEYWNFDVDFFQSKTVKLIQAQFGIKGVYIMIYILTEIYRTGGYYKGWDEDDCLLASVAMDSAGDCSPNLISDVVAGLVKRAFFDKDIFDRFHILTSANIQRRFLRMVGRSRDVISIIPEYFLLDTRNSEDVPEPTLKKIVFHPLRTENPSVTPPRMETPVSCAGNPRETPVSCAGNPTKESNRKDSTGKGKEKEKGKGKGKGKNGAGNSVTRRGYGHYRHVMLSEEEGRKLLEKLGREEATRCIRYIDESVQIHGNRNGWKDFYAVCLKCSREQWGIRPYMPVSGINQHSLPDVDPFDAAASRLETIRDDSE